MSMIQVITPNTFVKGTYTLKDAFVRFSPKRGEILLSSGLLSLIGFKKGQTILFALDSELGQIFISASQQIEGFRVSLNYGRGRIYSLSLIRLMERVLNINVSDPVSVPVEAISTQINKTHLYKLHTDVLKQCVAACEDRNPITVYKNKGYTKRSLLSLLRTYWERSFTSQTDTSRERNRRRYDQLKRHCEEHLLDIDFPLIESKFT